MKEVQVVPYCDVEWKRESIKVPATFTTTVTIDGADVELDLCEDHAAPVRAAMVIFDQFGVSTTPKKKGPKPKRLDCAVCGHVNNTRSALASHYKRVHHMSIQEAEESD